MADQEVVASSAIISVDIKVANEGTSESQTTPTPSKTQLNANAIEFVPGSLKSSVPSSPNAEVTSFAPGFPVMSNGYVPYYVYVPSTTDATASPVLTPGGFNRAAVPFQPAAPFQPVQYTARPARKGYGKGVRREVVSVEVKKQPDTPDFTKDFPSIGGPAPTPSIDSAKPSWAAIAKKEVSSPKHDKGGAPTIQSKPVIELVEKPESVVSVTTKEPAHEPTPRTVPGTRLAPWARVPAASEAPVIDEIKADTIDIEDVTIDDGTIDNAKIDNIETEYIKVDAQSDEVKSDGVKSDEVKSDDDVLLMSVSNLRRLRFHEQCRPLAEHRAVLPPSLLRQRLASEVEDWRAEAAATSRGSQKRRLLDRRVSSRIEISADMLIPSENSWSVAQQKSDSLVDENIKVGRCIFAVLNKLTVEKFEKLSDQLFTECGISKPAHIITLVKFLFEKATIQHNFIGMYADLCSKTLAWLSSTEAPEDLVQSITGSAASVFRRVLLERCQETFYSFFLTHDDTEGDESPSERTEEEHHKHRLQMLGTVKFVAQLLERRLMTRAVFKNCLDTLLHTDDRTDDHIECACVFLTEVGHLFEDPEDTKNPYTAALEEAMTTLIGIETDAGARIKFGIMNLVDLRANKWAKESMGPSRIAEVHKQVAKEDMLARTASRQKEDDWETVKTVVKSGAWKPKRS